MTQPAANEELSAYLDGELEDTEVAELEARLAAEPALREELEALSAAADFLRTHGPVRAPPGFHGRVMVAVEDEPVPGSWWRWLRRPFGLPVEGLAVAAAAVLVLVFALDLGRDAFEAPLDAEPAAPMDKVAAMPGEDDAVAQPDTDDLGDLSVGEDKIDHGGAFDDVKVAPKGIILKRTLGTEGVDEAPAEEVGKVKTLAPEGTSDTVAQPLGVTLPYSSYGVLSDDIYSLNKLQLLVAKLGGTVEVRKGDLGGKGSVIERGGEVEVMVSIPTEALADFDRLVSQLGQVDKHRGDPRGLVSTASVDIPLVIRVDAAPPPGPATQQPVP